MIMCVAREAALKPAPGITDHYRVKLMVGSCDIKPWGLTNETDRAFPECHIGEPVPKDAQGILFFTIPSCAIVKCKYLALRDGPVH